MEMERFSHFFQQQIDSYSCPERNRNLKKLFYIKNSQSEKLNKYW